MAYRYLNKPENTGYLVKQYNSCGKKNCRCARDGKGHEANYVYYRVYVLKPEAGTGNGFVHKLKKMYIKKRDLAKWERKIALAKAPFIYYKLPTEVFSDPIFKLKQKNRLFRMVYDKYRVRRTKGAKPRFTDSEMVKIREHSEETKIRYQRTRQEFSLIKALMKSFKKPYDSKARSSVAIKARIRMRQRYYASKHPSWA
jgi:hypothetical protein